MSDMIDTISGGRIARTNGNIEEWQTIHIHEFGVVCRSGNTMDDIEQRIYPWHAIKEVAGH